MFIASKNEVCLLVFEKYLTFPKRSELEAMCPRALFRHQVVLLSVVNTVTIVTRLDQALYPALGTTVIQRWANSVLMAKYEYQYYSVSQKWSDTNTNNIRYSKYYRIQIRILFSVPKVPKINTNIIWFTKNDRIRISFIFPKMTEHKYWYYLVSQKWPNVNTKFQEAFAEHWREEK